MAQIDIRSRTNSKIIENIQAGLHQWTFQQNGQKRNYLVFAGVFSPAIFLGTKFLTYQVVKRVKNGQKFLEIGCGCGVTSVQVALQVKGSQITAVDINSSAVNNTIVNMERYKVKLQAKVSDMFKSLEKDRYDIIYWNYPFHPSEYEHECLLEKAIRDPGYCMMDQFLQEASEWLEVGGLLLLGFSLTMGDLNMFNGKTSKYGWKCQKLSVMEGDSGSICLLGLSK